jgi:hypothetical protein
MGPNVLLFHHPESAIVSGSLLTVESNHFCVLKARGAVLNQLRADDLLVREHAGHSILQAAKKLQEQEADYARKFLPAPTRENPFSADDKLATHALIWRSRRVSAASAR